MVILRYPENLGPCGAGDCNYRKRTLITENCPAMDPTMLRYKDPLQISVTV